MNRRRPIALAFLLGLAVALSLAAIRPPNPGQLVYVYETTDVQLAEEIERARGWKDFWLRAGEVGWAAYYAGIEAHAQQQLDELDRRIAGKTQ
jgi:hypothetical protein